MAAEVIEITVEEMEALIARAESALNDGLPSEVDDIRLILPVLRQFCQEARLGDNETLHQRYLKLMGLVNSSETLGAIDQRNEKISFPLSAAQRGIWFALQIIPDVSSSFKVAEYLEINGPIDKELFEIAFRQVLGETECCRVTITDSIDAPQQCLTISPDWLLPILDLRGEDNPTEAAQAWMWADVQKPVDLVRGPLFSSALLQLGSHKFIYYQCCHHIAVDGITSALFLRRLADVYSSLVAGRQPPENPFGRLHELIE
ncbi:MAG: condensation domain-containing protein, partial [Exilibacterium sp.]